MVRNVINPFHSEGVDCLRPKSRRPKTVQPIFNPERTERLRAIVHQSPRTFGKSTAAGAATVKYIKDCLFYGPSAGGRLNDLAIQAGGKTLNHLMRDKPANMSVIEFSKRTLDSAASAGTRVYFDLSYAKDWQGMLRGTGPFADYITAQELRYIAANWERFRNIVTFISEGQEIAAPWLK
jgi:hypothetical protein